MLNIGNASGNSWRVHADHEAASRALAPTGEAIYSAVLAKNGTACPGSGFYDIFNNIHRDEFFEVTGHNNIHELTDEDRKNIANIERPRVYEHALSISYWLSN